MKRPALKPGHLPDGVSFWHPVSLICTWFGSGLLPKIPGTWGSAAALPFAWVIQATGGAAGLAFAALALFALGTAVSGTFARWSGAKDPGAVVVDEVAAQWLTLAAGPLDPLSYLAGFVLFRIADVLKPWPASWCELRFAGGLGVMADDMVSGVYSATALWLGSRWLV
jgi:phosphatidylglycerophosphatase A